jgi:hypothetical protein
MTTLRSGRTGLAAVTTGIAVLMDNLAIIKVIAAA